MYGMFYEATAFNQDLCAWYNKLLGLYIVEEMFTSSGCTNQATPDFSSKTSFCQACSCSGGKSLSIIWSMNSVCTSFVTDNFAFNHTFICNIFIDYCCSTMQ
jgi:hypothetical protein